MNEYLTEVAAATTVELIKKALNKMLDSNWLSGTEDSKSILEQLKKDSALNKYIVSYYNSVKYVRTIHKENTDVDLDDVYYPLKLTSENKKIDIVIKDGVVINNSGVVNIVGIAGQGKSTVLRKLFIEEFGVNNRFPFFIELRRVKENSILNELARQLNELNVTFSDKELVFLLQSGKVVLMLDGFDEIHSNNRNQLLENICGIYNRYNCSIITTSRPDTEICRAPRIKNLYIKNLEHEDCLGIIKKLGSGNEVQEITNLLVNNLNLLNTLITPILVNLLYVCYPYWDKVPDSVIDFYKRLFNTLYHKHDKLKNYARPRASTIISEEALWCFSALCFFSLKDEVYEYTDSIFNSYLKKIVIGKGYEENQASNLIKDICNITCLIQEDGFDRYVFIHKSVQEFHAASFISELDSKRKEEFYSYLIDIINLSDRYDNVIGYLSELDNYHYGNFFLLKLINGLDINNKTICDDFFIKKIIYKNFSNIKIIFDVFYNDNNCKESVFIQKIPNISIENDFVGLDFILHGNRDNNDLYRAAEYVFYKENNNGEGFCYSKITILDHTMKIINNKSDISRIKKNNFSGKNDKHAFLIKTIEVDFVKFILKYDNDGIFTNMVREKLSSYYNELYLPMKRKIGNKDNALDNLWDFK